MSGEDGFLNRWARRKAEARRSAPESAAPAPAPAADTLPAPPDGTAEPEFDLASLPSLESITAATDISAFMRAGVPEQLRNAALRTMWATDPAIRDYVGLSEYAWDFNTPGAISGFGEIAPGTDVARLVRDIMEGMPSAPLPDVEREAQALLEAAALEEQPAALGEPERQPDDALDLSEPPEVVTQISSVRPRRRHGGATPG